jgi:hypothetical protein
LVVRLAEIHSQIGRRAHGNRSEARAAILPAIAEVLATVVEPVGVVVSAALVVLGELEGQAAVAV